MLDKFDYVRITLVSGQQKEGYLVDISGNVGTLAGRISNTAFTCTSTLIEVLHPGHKPVFLPKQVQASSKPYRVAGLVGTHTACEDYFDSVDTAKSFAHSLLGNWTNNVGDKQTFYQYACVLVLPTYPTHCSQCGKPLEREYYTVKGATTPYCPSCWESFWKEEPAEKPFDTFQQIEALEAETYQASNSQRKGD